MGVQVGIVTDTLPHLGFQIFRQPDRNILVLSPFRLGGEPNVRVGVAMITSAPDALSFHEDAIEDMWGRALKGHAAAHQIRNALAGVHDIANAGESERAEQSGSTKRTSRGSVRMM